MIELKRRVSRADGPYVYLDFDLPDGTSQVAVTLAYPKAADCVIDLGLFDATLQPFPSPTGFRGWSGGAREGFFVGLDAATPGYVAGPMPAGVWQVILGLYRLPAEGAQVVVHIALDQSPRAVAQPTPLSQAIRPGAGWYRGDLHCHTYHSDAAGAPALLQAAARQAGLDFLAVTDHNTVSHWEHFNAASSPDLVFIRGMEVTTARGHANAFGTQGWVDFRITQDADVHLVAAEVARQGGVFSINHDKPTIPWDYPLPRIDCMEVWQSAWLAGNWISLAKYQARLAQGLRICAIGGSDYHQPSRLQPEGPFVLARPTTVLWMEHLSEACVLAAMASGHGYITESPTGPHLAITVGGQPMGGQAGSGAEAVAEVRGAVGDVLVWIDATGVLNETPIVADGVMPISLPKAKTFLRAEIVARASQARLLAEVQSALPLDDFDAPPPQEVNRIRRALSNPVYLG
ncbi:MAG: CehA/McbA family metallohydrolase [Pseudomonadota bacterium]